MSDFGASIQQLEAKLAHYLLATRQLCVPTVGVPAIWAPQLVPVATPTSGTAAALVDITRLLPAVRRVLTAAQLGELTEAWQHLPQCVHEEPSAPPPDQAAQASHTVPPATIYLHWLCLQVHCQARYGQPEANQLGHQVTLTAILPTLERIAQAEALVDLLAAHAWDPQGACPCARSPRRATFGLVAAQLDLARLHAEVRSGRLDLLDAPRALCLARRSATEAHLDAVAMGERTGDACLPRSRPGLGEMQWVARALRGDAQTRINQNRWQVFDEILARPLGHAMTDPEHGNRLHAEVCRALADALCWS